MNAMLKSSPRTSLLHLMRSTKLDICNKDQFWYCSGKLSGVNIFSRRGSSLQTQLLVPILCQLRRGMVR